MRTAQEAKAEPLAWLVIFASVTPWFTKCSWWHEPQPGWPGGPWQWPGCAGYVICFSVLGAEMGELEAKWPSSPVKEGKKQKYRGSDPMTMNIQCFRLLFLKEDCVHKQNQKIPFRVSPAFDSKCYVGSDFPFPGLSHYPIEFIRRLWLLAKRNG